MESKLVNTITKGAQFGQRHLQLSDGHIICWISTDHKSIEAQKLNATLEKVGEQFTIDNIGSPKYPDLFKTNNGFGVIYHRNDSQIYVKTYDGDGNTIAEPKRINQSQNYGLQSTDQKIGIIVEGGYLIVWAGSTAPTAKSQIWAQKINYQSEPIGDAFLINDPDAETEINKYNPSVENTDEGFLICWGQYVQDKDNKWGNQVVLKKFNHDGDSLGNQVIMNQVLTSGSRYNLIRKHGSGYIVISKAGYTDVYSQLLTEDLHPIGDYVNIQGSGFRGVDTINDEIIITKYESSEIYLQKYHLDGIINGEILNISDDPNNEYYDDGAVISVINSGYLVIYNSTRLNDNYEVFVKYFMYGDDTDTNHFSVVIDNSIRFTQFKNNISNLLEDIASIEEIQEKINDWVNKGINLNNSIEPLEIQHQQWTSLVDQHLEVLKNNFSTLKTYDDRITNEYEVVLDEEEYQTLSQIDKVDYLCSHYEELHHNINEDIVKLNQIHEEINKYTKLGVKLGEASELIQEQYEVLEMALQTASCNFDDIIAKTNSEINKIKIDN